VDYWNHGVSGGRWFGLLGSGSCRKRLRNKDLLVRFLCHVGLAYALPPLTREERAVRAKVSIGGQFNARQQSFISFVLAHYVGEGVEELDPEKLAPLLRLRYFNSTSDAVADLGEPEEIRNVFVGFQKYLYQAGA